MKRLLLLAALLVFAFPASAAAPRLLATEDAWPLWSPDGHTIAFTRIHQGRSLMELEVVDTRTHRVTKLAQNAYQLLPSWSPDGTRLAYQSAGSVYTTDLRGVKRRIGTGGAPAYGSSIARVENGALLVGGAVWAKAVIGQPAWSPDGTRIAFQRDNGIYVAAGPGGGTLLVGGANPGPPAWSPDSHAVAFALGSEIWVAGSGIVPAHAIATGRPDAGTPSFVPDGSAVVYRWRGGVTETTVGGHSTLLHAPAGLGASVSRAGAIAYSGPRASCPGHLAITVGARVLTGTCAVVGTARADTIEGTPLWGDRIAAGAGNDSVHANDRHTDRVDCGAGHDTVWADKTDKLVHCEVIHR